MLLTDRSRFRGAFRDGAPDDSTGIVHDQKGSARPPADGFGTEAADGWVGRRDPEVGFADRELSDDVIAVAHTVERGGAERLLVERDRRAGAFDPRFRLNA